MSKPSSPCAPPEVHTSRGTIPAFSHSAWNGATFFSSQPRTMSRNSECSVSYSEERMVGSVPHLPPSSNGDGVPGTRREDVCAAGEEGALLCGTCRLPGGGPGG